MNTWTDTTNLHNQDAQIALELARGSYQRALLSGRESLSGSTLRGKAASYSAHYKASARNYLDRLRAAGILVSERREARGKRVLVLASAGFLVVAS